jgi:hypothetical protein
MDDIDAVFFVLDHAQDALQVPVDRAQAIEHIFFGGCITLHDEALSSVGQLTPSPWGVGSLSV